MALRKSQIGACFSQPPSHLFRGPHRTGRLEHHKVAGLQQRCNRQARCLDVTELRLIATGFIPNKRCRHRHHKGICGLRLRRRSQVALGHGSMHHNIELWLYNMNFTTINRINSMLIYINTYNINFARGKDRGSGQADIAEANNRKRFNFHYLIFIFQLTHHKYAHRHAHRRRGCAHGSSPHTHHHYRAALQVHV